MRLARARHDRNPLIFKLSVSAEKPRASLVRHDEQLTLGFFVDTGRGRNNRAASVFTLSSTLSGAWRVAVVGLLQPTIAMDEPSSLTCEDEPLMVARAQRDPAAFEPLYGRYFDSVFRYCRIRLGDATAAEDATSQIFINALAALPRFQRDLHSGSFRSWLFTIAHNVVANQHRQRARHPALPLAHATDMHDVSPSPEDAAMSSETRQTVHALLAHLTVEQRQVVELRLGGLTDLEIASVLGRNHGAVRAAQYRAITRLRALLGAGNGESTHG
jgi:RNA polymerase sigma factor (sigma-70 family)